MRGIVPDDILDALKKKKLGLPGIDIEITEEKNPMQVQKKTPLGSKYYS